MSHGDKLSELPKGFRTVASSPNSPYAGIAHETEPIFGIQFHPEVTFVSPPRWWYLEHASLTAPTGTPPAASSSSATSRPASAARRRTGPCPTLSTRRLHGSGTSLGPRPRSSAPSYVPLYRYVFFLSCAVLTCLVLQSGGVDSTVASRLMQEAIGDR
ncbi:hypothetical protein IMZ48_15425 [Candidatus Bathyarchaeota archaeon]|nr:hypothetical protein [Candidatus Bathyarchaeota archaeon]